MTTVPKKRSKLYTENYTLRVATTTKQMEAELNKYGVDVPTVAREAIDKAFKDTLEKVLAEAG